MSNIIGNHVGGARVSQTGGTLQDVFNPSTGEVSGQVRLSSLKELDDVVQVASEAAVAWGATPPSKRVQVMYRFKRLLEENADKIASSISSEHGKTHDDALQNYLLLACGCHHVCQRCQVSSPAVNRVASARDCMSSLLHCQCLYINCKRNPELSITLSHLRWRTQKTPDRCPMKMRPGLQRLRRQVRSKCEVVTFALRRPTENLPRNEAFS